MSIFQNSILSKAASFGDAIALLDRASGSIVRYSDLPEFLDSILATLDLERRRPVATWQKTCFSHAGHLLAWLSQDGVVAPLSHRLPKSEALKRAAWIGARTLWTDEGTLEVEVLRTPIEVCGAGTILFTSGSSGSPAAVWHDLEAHISNAQGAAECIPLGPGCGWLLSLPLHHVSGFSILIRCLLEGATVVFPDPAVSLKNQIEDPAVTHLSLVGLQLRRLLSQRSSFHHLQSVLVGGGPIDSQLVSDSLEAGVPLHLTYGMTETASQISTSGRLDSFPTRIHAGKPLPGRFVRISADGEIQVRGAILPRAIFLEEGFRRVVNSEGWFATGDSGGFDAEGNLVIKGRRNRMFISGGENICPEIIENLLSSCEGVRRAVVVGVPHRDFGMRPVAFLAGSPSIPLVRDFLKSKLESFYVPDAFLPWPLEVSEDEAKVSFELFRRLAVAGRA